MATRINKTDIGKSLKVNVCKAAQKISPMLPYRQPAADACQWVVQLIDRQGDFNNGYRNAVKTYLKEDPCRLHLLQRF